jgi:hypothetical protein
MPAGAALPYPGGVRVTLALRLVGYVLLAVVVGATMLTSARMPADVRVAWLAAFAAFAIAFHVGASAPPGARLRRLVALGMPLRRSS